MDVLDIQVGVRCGLARQSSRKEDDSTVVIVDGQFIDALADLIRQVEETDLVCLGRAAAVDVCR